MPYSDHSVCGAAHSLRKTCHSFTSDSQTFASISAARPVYSNPGASSFAEHRDSLIVREKGRKQGYVLIAVIRKEAKSSLSRTTCLQQTMISAGHPVDAGPRMMSSASPLISPP